MLYNELERKGEREMNQSKEEQTDMESNVRGGTWTSDGLLV